MAELAVLNIAKSLLPQLSTLAKDELFLWYNSKDELKKLDNTIRTIKAVLHDAEQKKASNDAVRGWLSRLRDEMYKADDLFDTISTRALRKKVMDGSRMKKEMKLFFSKSNNHLLFIVKTAHKVKEFRGRLDDIAKDITQFGFIRSTTDDERPAIRRNAQHSYIPEDEVIGRDKDKEELLRLLMADAREDERVSVIAVVGIGGQGKTTLSQLIYNAKEMEEFFELRLWACINDFSSLEKALEEIMGMKTSSLDELQKSLRDKIQGKRFLLVVDDVWDDIREHWLRLKLLLDAGDRGSKILLTTRSIIVAQNLATVRPHYALGELSEEDAWILFKKMAFDSSNEEDDKGKEELGSQIIKKCPKVPLAIRTIGSFLYNKDKKQWSTFVDNELMKVIPKRENMIMHVLKISYDDLPSSIKHCFVYCSIFPKGYTFDKITLIHLWMAQDLLETSDGNPCLEDVGESYFMFLVQRCFFQNVKQDYRRIVICKMHDLFYDMAVQIAANECLTMAKVPEELGDMFPRHLLAGEIKGSLLQCKGMRSLVSPNTDFVERSLLDGVLLNLTRLRTLSLRHLDTEEIPNSIGKLIHLRYLDLNESKKLIRLPDNLCKLQNLLVLRLEDCSNLVKLPDDLHKLISLRCLATRGCYKLDHMPLGLEKMTSLVMLDQLIVNENHAGLRRLKRLNNLSGVIHIVLPGGQWKSCVEDAKESMLSSKTKLSGLFIRWKSRTQGEYEEVSESDAVLDSLQPSNNVNHLEVDGYPGVKFPDWISSLRNLVELTLQNCSTCCELINLRQLFQLTRLKLESIPHVEYVETAFCYDGRSFFPSLEVLNIFSMESLKGWWSSAGEEFCGAHELWFPRLSSLKVSGCLELISLPLCPVATSIVLKDVDVNLVKQLLRVPKPAKLKGDSCSKLRNLKLSGIKDLAFFPDELKLHPSLRSLRIYSCPNLRRYSLLHSLKHMSSIERFHVINFNRVDLLMDDEIMVEDGMPWVSLTSLRELGFEFGDNPQGARLLKGLHHLTRLDTLNICGSIPNDKDMEWRVPPNVKSFEIWYLDEVTCVNSAMKQFNKLQSLSIDNCNVDEHELDKLPWKDLKYLRKLSLSSLEKIKSLPDKCQYLPTLEDLTIVSCNEITYLPDWVSRLTSLQIIGCPKLEEKCRKPMGTYWPLIKDIPHLYN